MPNYPMLFLWEEEGKEEDNKKEKDKEDKKEVIWTSNYNMQQIFT